MLSGALAQPERWKQCVGRVDSALGFETGRAFANEGPSVRARTSGTSRPAEGASCLPTPAPPTAAPRVGTAFSSASREAALHMIVGIKSAFKDNLPDVSWMDDTARDAAAAKADKVFDMIGYPAWQDDDEKLEARRCRALEPHETALHCPRRKKPRPPATSSSHPPCRAARRTTRTSR